MLRHTVSYLLLVYLYLREINVFTVPFCAYRFVSTGDIQGVKDLVESGEIYVNEKGAQDRTALHRQDLARLTAASFDTSV